MQQQSQTSQQSKEETGVWDDGVATFIKSLLHMLQDPENTEVIYWTKRGSFIVRDCSEFETRILPKYFKTSKFCSFVRQLNTYGFRKVDSPHDPLQKRYEFYNRYFRSDHPELLKYIQRRKSVKKEQSDVDILDDLQRSPLAELGASGLENSNTNNILLAEIARLQKQHDETQFLLKGLVEEVHAWKQAHTELQRKVDGLEKRKHEKAKRTKYNEMSYSPMPSTHTPLHHVAQHAHMHTNFSPIVMSAPVIHLKTENMEYTATPIHPYTSTTLPYSTTHTYTTTHPFTTAHPYSTQPETVGSVMEGSIPFELLSSSLPQLEY